MLLVAPRTASSTEPLSSPSPCAAWPSPKYSNAPATLLLHRSRELRVQRAPDHEIITEREVAIETEPVTVDLSPGAPRSFDSSMNLV
jgi:hypothetical protein